MAEADGGGDIEETSRFGEMGVGVGVECPGFFDADRLGDHRQQLQVLLSGVGEAAELGDHEIGDRSGDLVGVGGC